MLSGYKTYIVSALLALLTIMKMAGQIDQHTFEQLAALLVSGGLATVRSAINNIR